MSDEFVEYDESDLESDFEDLEYDEARRRRRRRGRGRGGVSTNTSAWRRPTAPPTNAAAAQRRELEAARARDKQLAREVNTTKQDVGDVETQLRKVNSDLARLRQISMISLIMPRSQDISTQRLRIAQDEGGPRLETTTDTNNSVPVVTGVSSKLDILPLILFMTMARGVGTPARPGSPMGGLGGGDNSMMMLMVVLLMQQQQQQAAAAGGTATTSSTTDMLPLILIMSMGGLS